MDREGNSNSVRRNDQVSAPPQPLRRDLMQLDQVLARFLEAVRAGQNPNRQQLLDEHPHLREELEAFFGDHDRLQRFAGPWTGPAGTAQFGRSPDLPGAATDLAAAWQTRQDDACRSSTSGGGSPRRLGDYELLEEIGRGGMGMVYKARQVSLNRIVALKMMGAGQLATEADRRRFRTEAEAAASLDHPNVVSVYEVGELGGQGFFSMQYVEGRNLAQLQQDGPVPFKEAAHYVRQIAQAIAHAHNSGVLHRDLKPSNVLIDALGQARVTDFGLAKQVNENRDLTLSGQVLGTPSFMSPEQAGAKRGTVGPASDIYSTGAVLYTLLTGYAPFRADTPVETLWQVRENDPVLPRQLNPQVPRDLEMICLKCLEKDPRHRYPTARDLVEDLDRYLQGESISIRGLNLFDRLVRTLERGHHDVEFQTWSHMLFRFVWIVLAAHLLIFLVSRRGSPHSLIWLAAVRGCEFLTMGWVFWSYRRDWYPPRGGPSRQLWAMWLAYVAGSIVLAIVGNVIAAQFDYAYDELVLYPQSAVLAGLAFIMMGASYWGYCYLIGAGFFALALVMSVSLPSAPIVFGLAWAFSLAALGHHLRRVAR